MDSKTSQTLSVFAEAWNTIINQWRWIAIFTGLVLVVAAIVLAIIYRNNRLL